MTKLERKLLKRKALIFFLWVCLLAMIAWTFSIHWILGFVWITLPFPLLIWGLKVFNLYYCRADYFVICRGFSKDIRRKINEQCASGSDFPHIGELVFTDDYIVFTKFGAMLSYNVIRTISHNKGPVFLNPKAFVHVIQIQTTNGAKYKCEIYNDDSLFVGENSAFERAMEFYRIKKETCTKKNDSENWINT